MTNTTADWCSSCPLLLSPHTTGVCVFIKHFWLRTFLFLESATPCMLQQGRLWVLSKFSRLSSCLPPVMLKALSFSTPSLVTQLHFTIITKAAGEAILSPPQFQQNFTQPSTPARWLWHAHSFPAHSTSEISLYLHSPSNTLIPYSPHSMGSCGRLTHPRVSHKLAKHGPQRPTQWFLYLDLIQKSIFFSVLIYEEILSFRLRKYWLAKKY